MGHTHMFSLEKIIQVLYGAVHFELQCLDPT